MAFVCAFDATHNLATAGLDIARFSLQCLYRWRPSTLSTVALLGASRLKFRERARSEWLRALGFEQDELRSSAGVMFVVRKVEVDYLSPARFNDEIHVDVSVHEVGCACLSVKQTLTRGPTRLVLAKVRLALLTRRISNPLKYPRSFFKHWPKKREP